MGNAIELEINGRRYAVRSPGETRLLFVLRDELGLTGPKYGCGEGQCGACAVLIRGGAHRSCLMPVSEAVGKSITTIGGLEKDGRLHPVQQAFLDAGAFQCAYCTSGMIMGSVQLLESNPKPSREEIAHALQGNICRCGTHPRVVEAVQRASAMMQEKRS